MSNPKVTVRVLNNGVVVHQHDGANGWHDPSRKHGTMVRFGVAADLHKQIGTAALTRPGGLDKLSAAQRGQYAEALKGKTFWVYAKKAVATPPPAPAKKAPKPKTPVAAKADGAAPPTEEKLVNGAPVKVIGEDGLPVLVAPNS